MNYIKKLEKINSEQKQTMDLVKNDLDEFFTYINSSKFNCGNELDGYVNVSDVMNRIQHIRALLN